MISIILTYLCGQIANAEPESVPMELDGAFYDWECDKGGVVVKVRSNYCEKNGLYRISANLKTTNGRMIETNLVHAKPCETSDWSARIKGLSCSEKKSDVLELKVTAYVDPVVWKEALKSSQSQAPKK